MLNQKDVHGFRSKLKKDGLSNTSCNQAIKIISTSLNSALRQGIIPMNPAAAVESLPKEKSVRKPFTKAQLKKLIKASDNEWRIAILMGFYTGARLRDIADMTWESINFEKGTISFIAGKTKKETIIPIHPSLKEALLDAAGQDDLKTHYFRDFFDEHFLEQYFTASQFNLHFFLQLNGKLHVTQTFHSRFLFIAVYLVFNSLKDLSKLLIFFSSKEETNTKIKIAIIAKTDIKCLLFFTLKPHSPELYKTPSAK